ncbi:Uncharacterised protein [Mycobacterium tuberculosis]|nr:Uncharacterised protein [Mycobacterium tuberculosis]
MSASSIGPADQPNQRRAARNVSRASCSPVRNPSSTPVAARTSAVTSSRLAASRSADVAYGTSSATSRAAAAATDSRTAAMSRPTAGRPMTPCRSVASASRTALFTDRTGAGGWPGSRSATRRCAEFEPMSSTPRRRGASSMPLLYPPFALSVGTGRDARRRP